MPRALRPLAGPRVHIGGAVCLGVAFDPRWQGARALLPHARLLDDPEAGMPAVSSSSNRSCGAGASWTSRAQAIFADSAIGASLLAYAVLLKIDRFG